MRYFNKATDKPTAHLPQNLRKIIKSIENLRRTAAHLMREQEFTEAKKVYQQIRILSEKIK